MTVAGELGWMGAVALASAGLSAVILVVHLARRSALTAHVKLWLLLGLGGLPIVTALTANVQGFEATTARPFCGSCHVMIPHAADSEDPTSRTLAALHARNGSFGEHNCYTCHKDYGMYGYVATKMGGMRHVYLYLTQYHDMPLEQARHDIRILKPLPNANCMSCHTGTAPRWLAVPDHAATLDRVRQGTLSCASAGCHGYAHPMTKVGKELPGDGGALEHRP